MDLSEINALLRESAESFIAKRHNTAAMKGNTGSPRKVDRQLWREMAEAGWLAIGLPEALGGLNAGIGPNAELAEIFGRAAFPEPFAACAVMPAFVLAASPAELAAPLAEEFITGERIFTLAWQEDNEGMAASTFATAFKDGRLSGVKRYVPAAEDDGLLIVAASSAEGLVLLAVDAGADGVVLERYAAGNRAFATVTFDNVVVAAAPLLVGDTAGRVLGRALEAGRVVAAAELAGLAAGALERTVRYVSDRVQFGKPIGTFQSVQHRCVDRHIEAKLAGAAWRAAARVFECDAGGDETKAKVSAAKARCGTAALDAGKTAIQLHGAFGFTEESDIGLYFRQAMATSVWLGSPAAHRSRFMANHQGNEQDAHAPSSLTGANAAFGEWLSRHYPDEWRQDMRRPFRRLRGPDVAKWFAMLNDAGWRAPAWPKEYGGLGFDFAQQLAYHDELERAGAARVIDLGEAQLGPTLMQYGTDAQKEYYLPRILSGEHIWCQGYSEPNAGSDLASLRTQAIRDGDHFVVNGQKTWTTSANDATHIFVLVRTAKTEKKQHGISFLLADITTPGISIRPIVNLAGEDEFCEVFFDDVRIPVDNLVGEIDKGWTVAKTLLGYERVWNGSPALAAKALALAQRLISEAGWDIDPELVARNTALTVDLHDYRELYRDLCDALAAGSAPGPELSILKIYASELLQRLTEFNHEVAGSAAMVVGDVEIGRTITDLHWQNMMSRPPTIFAGANEVQRDIVARAVLGLPSARSI